MEAPEPYSSEYLLAVLLSDVAEWRFRMTSTNNNVNAYEVDELPFPLVDDWDEKDRATQASELAAMVESLLGASGWQILEGTSDFLRGGGSRTAAHDAISELGRRTTTMRADALGILDAFRLLLRSLPNGNRIGDAFVGGRWLQFTEVDFFAQIASQGVSLTTRKIQQLNLERVKVASRVMPLIQGAAAIDRALSEMVSAMHGLTPSEAQTVSAALPVYADLLIGIPT
jgi:hypothetical protein